MLNFTKHIIQKKSVPLECILPPKPRNLASGLYSPPSETNALCYPWVCLCHESPSCTVCLKPLCLHPYPQVHQIDENSKSGGYQRRRKWQNWWRGACRWRILWRKRWWWWRRNVWTAWIVKSMEAVIFVSRVVFTAAHFTATAR